MGGIRMNRKDFIKHGGINVTMTGEVCCSNENCPYINDIGCCTDINAKCDYSKQRNEALLHYMFDDDRTVEFELK